jgi:signal transduction histidine kinase
MQVRIATFLSLAARRPASRYWIVAAGIAALFVAAVVAIEADREETMSVGAAEVAAKTDIVVAHVDQVLRSIDLSIRTLDERPATPDAFNLPPEGELKIKLEQIQSGTDGLLAIAYVDAAGHVTASSAGTISPSLDLSARPYFRAHRDVPSLGLLISPPFAVDGEVIVAISRGVYVDGKFKGVITGRLDPEYFQRFFRSVDADSVALILENGAFVERWPRIDVLHAPPHSAGRIPFGQWAAGSAKPVIADSPFDDVERIHMVRSLRTARAGIALSMDVDRVLAQWKVRRNILLMAAAAISVLAVMLAMVVDRRARDRAARAEAEALAAASHHAQVLALEASRRKSEFLAHMSHEIRTPLNAILGFSEMMKEQVLGPIAPAKYLGYAADIHYSAAHLLSVVNNVLDLAKVEAGKWSQSQSEIPLADLIGAVCRLTAQSAEREGVRLVVLPLPAVVLLGDERMLRQILVNLVANAVRFAGDDRTVELACALETDGGLRLSVTDRGIGLSAHDIERALRPFETAADTRARQRQDTGLGLPLARMFAEMHEGELTIDSRPVAGTTVSVRLPAARVLRAGR